MIKWNWDQNWTLPAIFRQWAGSPPDFRKSDGRPMPLKSGRFFFSDWHSSKLEIDGIPLIDVSGQDPPCIDYLTLSALTGCLQAREWLKCISLGFIFAFVGFSAGIGGAWRLSGNIFFNSQFLWTAAGEPWVVLACCGGLDGGWGLLWGA